MSRQCTFEFNISYIYFLSNISIVLRPVTLKLKLRWRDFLILFIYSYFLWVDLILFPRDQQYYLNKYNK